MILHVFTTSQIEYWKREFPIQVQVNDFNLTKIVTSILLGQIPIIEMNPETLEHLQGIDLGSNSFVAYINADEKYEKKFNFDLIKFSNVKAIIRPYSLN